MKKILLLILILFSAKGLYAASVSGKVFDSKTKSYISGVTVGIEETSIVTQTDDKGNFQFNDIDRGYYTLYFSHNEYGTKKTVIKVKKDFYITMPLSEVKNISPLMPKDDDVKKNINQSITQSDIKTFPLRGAGDSLHLLQTLPGIGGAGSFATVPVIRGSNPLYNKIYIDDLAIEYPYHYLGVFVPVMSSINEQIISDAVVYKGNSPVWTGDHAGNVIQVRTNTADNEGLHGKVLLDPLFPLLPTMYITAVPDEQISMVYSLRRSLHDILTDTQYTNSSLSDFYFNLNYVLNDQHSLSLIVFESEDEVSYNENQFMAKSSSSVYALKWDFLIGDKMFLKTIASNNEVQQYLKNEQIYSGKAGAYMNLNPTQLKLFQSLYYVYNRHKFQIGYEYVNHRDGIDANISISDIPSTKVFDKTSASKTITYPIEGNSIALFADYAADWGKLTTDVGARAERYGPTEKFSMSYKTEAGYDILDDLNLYAKHSRSIAHPDMYYYIGKKNPDFEDAVTMYFGMGSLYEFMKNGIFQSELFYNKYDNMNPGTLVTMNRDEFKKLMQLHPFSQEISGYDYGLELMLKSRYQNYYGWMSYTYTASSRENKTASDFESDFSQPHLFKVTAASFWGKWNPSLVYNLFSSMPYTPAAVVTDVNGNPVNGYGKINSERYGISSRLDMKVNYYYDKETRLYFEVWNILYNSNEVASSYDAGKTISGSNPKKYEDIPILVWAGMEICF